MREKPLILLVDDNVTNLDILVNLLKGGYRLAVAKNGPKALLFAKEHQPDLILLDIMMPGMDGHQVCSLLKSSPETRHIAVIFITAIHESMSKTMGFKLGAVDYITKPFDAAEVKARVHTHISLIRYRDRLEDMVRVRTAQLEKTNRELEETRMQIIQRLGKAAEYKDDETGRHVIRVSLYSAIVAEALGIFDEKAINLIRISSPMHDIGKIGIPDRILTKPGPLDHDEWEIMKQHCTIGESILTPSTEWESILSLSSDKNNVRQLSSDSELLKVARKIALCHHEHWDGKGYPTGLKEEEIPIEARIVAIADIYDALSSRRPYKVPFAEQKCQDIIKTLSGTHLDPDVVKAFFESIDRILDIKAKWKD